MDGMTYRRGIAQGIGQIARDAIFFRYRDETWEFPTYDVLGYRGIAHFNGVYYEAKVKDLRKLAKNNKEQAHG